MSEIAVLKADVLGEGKILFCMVGLPYSGKSTRAKGMSFPIVCPDTIRIALHGHKFITEAEPHVWAIAKTMVRALFLAGHDRVILDATNTTEDRRKEWVSKDWLTEWYEVRTPADICLQRAKAAGDDHILPIIESMAAKLTFPSDDGTCAQAAAV